MSTPTAPGTEPSLPDPKKSEFPMPRSELVVGQHPPERLALIHRLGRATTVCTVAIIVLGVLWELWLAPLPGGTGALTLKVLPLVFAVRGLWQHRLYTYRWMSLLIWLYFTEGTMRAASDAGLSAALGLIEALLSLSVFVFIMLYVRNRLKVLPPRT